MNESFRVRTAEILCVGTELLIGDIVNTNAAFLSQRLAEIGICQYHQGVVGDNTERLSYYLSSALERADLVILTGGLGPTQDDLTKETAAALMERELVCDEEAMKRIESHFAARRTVMTENNKKQALVPQGSVVFQNDVGTAPGMAIEDAEKGKIVVLLPGPPREMRPMFENSVFPYLSSFSDRVFFSRNVNICGMGESKVAAILDEMIEEGTNPTVAPYAMEGEVRLRVTASGKTKEECLSLCDRTVEEIRRSPVGEFIYGMDTTLWERAVSLLKQKGLALTVSEKATGGLLSWKIASVQGAEDVFSGGIVLPSRERCEAPSTEELLQSRKSVETLDCTDADVSLIIGDFCNPQSGAREKAVSYAVYVRGGSPFVETAYLRDNGRDYLRECAVKRALSALIRQVGKAEKEAGL